MSGPTKCSHV